MHGRVARPHPLSFPLSPFSSKPKDPEKSLTMMSLSTLCFHHHHRLLRISALRLEVKPLQSFLLCSTRTLHSSSTPMTLARRFVPSRLDGIEDVEDYRPGGFHPISIGDCFAQGRYRVLHKLGYGGLSTVWLARDQKVPGSGKLVTLKAMCADASIERNPALTIPETLRTANPSCAGIQTVDHHFFVQGPNGSHLFLVSPFAGPSVLAMSDSPGRVAGSRRLRADLARKVAKQIATTIHCMHRIGVVHGGKVLLSVSQSRCHLVMDTSRSNHIKHPVLPFATRF